MMVIEIDQVGKGTNWMTWQDDDHRATQAAVARSLNRPQV